MLSRDEARRRPSHPQRRESEPVKTQHKRRCPGPDRLAAIKQVIARQSLTSKITPDLAHIDSGRRDSDLIKGNLFHRTPISAIHSLTDHFSLQKTGHCESTEMSVLELETDQSSRYQGWHHSGVIGDLYFASLHLVLKRCIVWCLGNYVSYQYYRCTICFLKYMIFTMTLLDRSRRCRTLRGIQTRHSCYDTKSHEFTCLESSDEELRRHNVTLLGRGGRSEA